MDKCRKSLLMRTPVPSEEEKQVDKGRKLFLVRGKVKGCIACSECNKPRCRYSYPKLTSSEVSEIIADQKHPTAQVVHALPSRVKSWEYHCCSVALVCYKHRLNTTAQFSYTSHQFATTGIGEESLVDEEVKEVEELCSCLSNLLFMPE